MNSNPWHKYNPLADKIGKLCFMYCSKKSALPVRDILNEHNKGFKSEPNYETATYNRYSSCNQRSVKAAINDRLSHILFITKYTGQKKEHHGRYFIVGYFEIGWVSEVDGRVAVRANRMCFVPIENAYEITDTRWKRIAPRSQMPKLGNLRWATQRIKGQLLEEIINHLDKGNATNDFLYETARLKSEYNPFKEIPNGRIFIINVGANTSSQVQSPAFEDGRFEFIPILEHAHLESNKALSYADLRQFNFPEKPLLDLFSKVAISPADQVHNDPEFITHTFGDNVKQKSNLRDLQSGDFLFFLARLVPYDFARFRHEKAFFALVGYLEIAEDLNDPNSHLFTSPAFEQNAHFIRWLDNPSSFNNFTIFKGSTNSRRFRYAIHFDRKFVENVPLLKANGSIWDWNRTTELGVIGSNTRTVRMHIDPKTAIGKQQAEKFWEYIWEVEKWNDVGKNKIESC